MNSSLRVTGISDIRWEQGNPSERILAVCHEENVDLLIAGALGKENLMQSYLGSIARKILRQADYPVLTLIDPQTDPKPLYCRRLPQRRGILSLIVGPADIRCPEFGDPPFQKQFQNSFIS